MNSKGDVVPVENRFDMHITYIEYMVNIFYTMSRRPQVIKKSYGIIVCRRNVRTRAWEVLAVKKRNTYAFVEFILKRHNRNDEKKILYLLNNMTYDEKVDLLSLNFGQIWHRFQLLNPDSKVHGAYINQNINLSLEDYEKYKIRKANFEKTFLSDKGKLLRKLISRSHNSINNWELPKGRQNGPEKILNCAIRETTEETGLRPVDYRLLVDEELLCLVQPTPTVRYESYYYVAVIHDPRYNPRVPERMEVGKPSEIAEIKWMTLSKIQVVDDNEKLSRIVNTAFKIVRSKYKYDRLLDLDLI